MKRLIVISVFCSFFNFIYSQEKILLSDEFIKIYKKSPKKLDHYLSSNKFKKINFNTSNEKNYIIYGNGNEFAPVVTDFYFTEINGFQNDFEGIIYSKNDSIKIYLFKMVRKNDYFYDYVDFIESVSANRHYPNVKKPENHNFLVQTDNWWYTNYDFHILIYKKNTKVYAHHSNKNIIYVVKK
jgi:hypothetical protein